MKKKIYRIIFIISAVILVFFVWIIIGSSGTLKISGGRLKEDSFLFGGYEIKEDGYIRFNLYGDNESFPYLGYDTVEKDRDYITEIYRRFLMPDVKEDKYITVPVFEGDQLHYFNETVKFAKYELVEKMPEIDESSLYISDKEEILFEYKDDTIIIKPKKMEAFLNDNVKNVSFISNENMIPKVITFSETLDGIEMVTTIDNEETKVIIENDTELVFDKSYKTYVYYQY